MAEVDSLGTNFYYAGTQSATNEALKKNQKNERTSSARKLKFSELLKSEAGENQTEIIMRGLPPEISGMSVDDAAIFLKDAVDNAGNDLSESLTKENIEKFKTSVRQFVTFVVSNNFEVTARRKKNRMGKDMIVPSRTNFFSNYTLPPHRIDPKYQIQIINAKLDEFTRATLENQIDNLKILAQANEIKGLIIDLMSS
ncbi:MAG: YaaR family protein [Treponema sp.]|nr:YaaR family protein [Treponema sp.]